MREVDDDDDDYKITAFKYYSETTSTSEAFAIPLALSIYICM